jgi:glycosyltransferase involved in cell wall biosynthesis
MEIKRAIFLTHPDQLRSNITGGVQLCSQEFHHIIENMKDITLQDYFVPFTRNVLQRLSIKLGFENYSVYNVVKDSPGLLKFITDHNIELVFINMANAVRYARPVKERFGDKVKTILLSHGNQSGDFLHLITKPISRKIYPKRWVSQIRLGELIATEANFRVNWLDGVVALSETEKQIENWFGAKKTVFLPRRLYKDFLDYQPVPGRVGFVGRLDHPPNLQGVNILLRELSLIEHRLDFRLVGAPTEFGEKIRNKYPFVSYLGELSDRDLELEVATWSFLLNPVWWYAMGASTKLARAISWGVPILTTTAGMRGYEWKEGKLLVSDSPEGMARLLVHESWNMEKISFWNEQTKLIAGSGLSQEELANRIRFMYL